MHPNYLLLLLKCEVSLCFILSYFMKRYKQGTPHEEPLQSIQSQWENLNNSHYVGSHYAALPLTDIFAVGKDNWNTKEDV